MEGKTLSETDALFLAFLREVDEARSDELLGELICNHAQPIIRQIIWNKFHVHPPGSSTSAETQHSEDLANEVIVQLLKRLRDLKSKTCTDAPIDFRSYLATTTYNAFYGYLRERHPQRHRLKNKIRYILTHKAGLALWLSDTQELLCGFKAWRSAERSSSAKPRLQQLIGSVQAAELGASLRDHSRIKNPARVLASIFNSVGGPVRLEDLIDLAADEIEIGERRVEAEYDSVYKAAPSCSDISAELATHQEQRKYLDRLWVEIQDLPFQQRTALLLNLRDRSGNDIITLISHLRIASLREIAETLAMTAECLAGIWNDLPLEDADIARRLCVNRQQVISLRLSARRRLSRRMKAFEEEVSRVSRARRS